MNLNIFGNIYSRVWNNQKNSDSANPKFTSNRNVLLLILVILLIFISLYIFTRPAFFECWNFTDTGQIGETIGGISAPIIGVIGIILVYITFLEQNIANNRQDESLKKMESSKIFDKHIMLFDNIKNRLNVLEFVVEVKSIDEVIQKESYIQPQRIVYKGINALDEFTKRIEYQGEDDESNIYDGQSFNEKSMILNFHYMLVSLHDLLDRINRNIIDNDDKEYLYINVKYFYLGFLEQFGEIIINYYSKIEGDDCELKIIKEKIDVVFNSNS